MSQKYFSAVLKGDRNLNYFISDYFSRFPNHNYSFTDDALVLELNSEDQPSAAFFLENILNFLVPKFLANSNKKKIRFEAQFEDRIVNCSYELG